MTEIMEALKTFSTEKLCEAFELTNNNNDENISFARGVLMDELELRDPVIFDNWMNTENVDEMDYPSLFF